MKQNSQIMKYNQLFYNSGPITVSDFISDTPDAIHNELYNQALENFLEEHSEYKDNNDIQILEIKNKEYWQASYIKIIDYSKYPRKQTSYWLDNWWNYEYIDKSESNVVEFNSDNNSEIDYIDYVNGKAIMIDRVTNDSFKTDLKNLSAYVSVTDNYNVYPTTFAYKKIYGNGV